MYSNYKYFIYFFVSDYAIQITCNQLLPSSMLRTVNDLNVIFCKKLLAIFIKKNIEFMPN